MMDLNEEFIQEATVLLEEAESALLDLEKSKDKKSKYNIIFRSFHSVKGGSGMMGFDKLQSHVHLLESQLSEYENKLNDINVDYFLNGIDFARGILSGNDSLVFESNKKEKNNVINFKNYKCIVVGQENVSFFNFKKVNKEDFFSKKLYLSYDLILTNDESFFSEIEKKKIKLPIFSEKKGLIINEANFVECFQLSKNTLDLYRQFEKATSLLMYQYVDIEEFLVQSKKTHVLNVLKQEIFKLIDFKNKIGGN